MAFYNGVECPVCHEKFVDGDDVVTCPVCGTPHHRACYEHNGNCANSKLHAEGFEFDIGKHRAESAPAVQAAPPQTDGRTVCPECHTEYDDKLALCPNCGKTNDNRAPVNPLAFPFQPFIQEDFEKTGEDIFGESEDDIASVVRVKIPRYLNVFRRQFQKKRKTGWNWAAFIFGPYWFFYRRINKTGVLFMGIQLIISVLMSALFNTQLTNFLDLYYNRSAELLEAIEKSSGDFMSVISQFPAFSQVFPVLAIMFVAGLVLRVVFAMSADNSYRVKVLSVIKKTKDDLKNGAILTSTTVTSETLGNIKLGQKEMYKIYLSKLGGVSLFAPMTGYFGYYMVQMFISYIIGG